MTVQKPFGEVKTCNLLLRGHRATATDGSARAIFSPHFAVAVPPLCRAFAPTCVMDIAEAARAGRDGHHVAGADVIPLPGSIFEDDGDDVAVDGLAFFPSGVAEAGSCKTIEVAESSARRLV